MDMRNCSFYRCTDCTSTVASTEQPIECGCGGKFRFEGTLRGKTLYSEKVACDMRCQAASTASKCVCACGGANHAHSVYREVVAGKVKDQPLTAELVEQGKIFRQARIKYYMNRPVSWKNGSWLPNGEWQRKDQAEKFVAAALSGKRFETRMRNIVAAHKILGV